MRSTASPRYPDIAFRKASLNELSAATGLKFNIVNRLLVNANLLFRLNSGRPGRQGLAAHRARVRVLVMPREDRRA